MTMAGAAWQRRTDYSDGGVEEKMTTFATTAVKSWEEGEERWLVVEVVVAASAIVERFRRKTEKRSMISSFGAEIASSLGLERRGDRRRWPQRVAVVVVVDDGEATPRPLDTRMSSVRRREATGGNLVVDAMHWTLEMGVARGDGGGGGGAAVEINGDFTFVIRCFKINFKNISCRDSLGAESSTLPGQRPYLFNEYKKRPRRL